MDIGPSFNQRADNGDGRTLSGKVTETGSCPVNEEGDEEFRSRHIGLHL
jgi:hypothetical protein